MNKTKLWTLLGLSLGLIVIVAAFTDMAPQRNQGDVHYTISQRWELPSHLREISGIDWLEEGKIAAVQDEEGIIFIYNLMDKNIEKKIEFADSGDYEGIAVSTADAYVLRSDGVIFEITDFRDADRTIISFGTNFTAAQEMESLEWDADNNRLLIAPKTFDQNSEEYKGIYAFSLDSKEMQTDPIHKISMTDKALKRFRKNELYKTFRPSDMAINPTNGDIFLLEGTKPRLLIMDAEGNLKNAYALNRKLFPQPEGITFSPDGKLYISSEGKKDAKASISEMELTVK